MFNNAKKVFEKYGAGSWKIAKAMRKVYKHSNKETATRAAMHRYWHLTYLGADREQAAFAAWYSCALDMYGIQNYWEFIEYYLTYFKNVYNA